MKKSILVLILVLVTCLSYLVFRSPEKVSKDPIVTSRLENNKVEKVETSKGTVTLEVTLNPTFVPVSNTPPIPVATKTASNVSNPNSKK
jgi:hypothetical protein